MERLGHNDVRSDKSRSRSQQVFVHSTFLTWSGWYDDDDTRQTRSTTTETKMTVIEIDNNKKKKNTGNNDDIIGNVVATKAKTRIEIYLGSTPGL